MPSMIPRLEEAVRRLYDAFGGYPFNPRMSRCDHCIDDREFAALAAQPLEALDDDGVGLLVSNLMLTVGEAPDFKHFLPRLFEVHVRDPSGPVYSAEMLFSKLASAGWSDWPRPERDAVQEFIEAYWEDRLSSFPGVEPASDFVCSVAIAGADPILLVEQWWTAGTEAAALHLADFLEKEREQPNAWWEGKDFRAAWMALVLRERSLRVLERGAEMHGSGPHAELLATARTRLAERRSL